MSLGTAMLKAISLLFFVWLPTALAAGKTILIVESYHADFHWDKAYRNALSEALSPGYSLEFFEMNTKRLPVERHAEMASRALARIKQVQPALVILGDDAALKLLGRQLDPLNIPAVYLGVNGNPRQYGQGNFRNITGVLERPLIKRSLAFIRQILPATRKILLLFDVDLTSGVIRDEVFHGKTSTLIDGIRVDMQLCPTVADWKHAVANARDEGYQVTVVGLYQTLKGSDGKVADADEIIRWTSANTPLPVFALWDFSVGPDTAIGGLVIGGAEQGKAAAVLARKILEADRPPATLLPVTARQGDFLFSRKQLEKYRLMLPTDIARHARLID